MSAPSPEAASYDTIVVGGGIAGLTSAAYLSRAGRKVLLIEKNKECGGLVNTFTHNGFRFDAGVRALENAGIIFPLLQDLGITMEVVKSPVSVGVEKEILHIRNHESLREYRDMLARIYPESTNEIDDVIALIRKIMKYMDVLYGVENPVFKDMKRDREFLMKQLLPWLPKFLLTVRKINRLSTPVEDTLERIIRNPSLRDIIAQHFFLGTPTFFALSYFSLYLDYFYPKGGVGALAEGLANKIRAEGGEIMTETTVTDVFAEQHSLRDDTGRTYAYDTLIWAADLKTLYHRTQTDGLPQREKKQITGVKNAMLKGRGSESVFSLFLEVDVPLETFREISHGHFFYTPSKRGLGETHHAQLRQLLDNWETTGREQVFSWLDAFTEYNTFEISIPGLKYADMAPPGQSGLVVSLLAEYDLFVKVRDAGWLEEFTAGLEARIVRVLSHSIFPMLKDAIIEQFSFSPLSIENRIGSSEGAIVGWSFAEPLPVLSKIQQAGRAVLTPIPDVYQAGQWAYSPGGVPMSILTGKLAADRVLRKR
ncbi:MAG: NAD(P)/FAD-dependent oxidoreductase [Bacteroidetes bacterium]|nr:NAD(P)/FAD-dependent oxidoreductase [Bacteroidota bacterium]